MFTHVRTHTGGIAFQKYGCARAGTQVEGHAYPSMIIHPDDTCLQILSSKNQVKVQDQGLQNW